MKTCETCKWAEVDSLGNTVCLSPKSKHWLAEGARIAETDRGLSGRH